MRLLASRKLVYEPLRRLMRYARNLYFRNRSISAICGGIYIAINRRCKMKGIERKGRYGKNERNEKEDVRDVA